MKCIITTGPFARRLCHLAKRLSAYEVSFTFMPATGECSGELWTASGKVEHFEGDDFDEIADAIYHRLLGIRMKQVRASLHGSEGEFHE